MAPSDMPFKKRRLSETLLTETCPACAYHIAVPFYEGGRQPLTTLAWPLSEAEAKTMKRLPLSFVRCVDCGHVYNKDFEYGEVPYSDKPNLMFNRGTLWRHHLKEIREILLAHLPEKPVTVEIGCGDGHFLKALAEARPQGRYIGFDPNGTAQPDSARIEMLPCLFEPETHLAEYAPHVIIIRHMLEHLKNPQGFVQALSFAAAWGGREALLFIEVPCIDRVFDSGRTVDFFYEHNSHFTTRSFRRLLERCGTRVELIGHGYDDEVIYGLARLGQATHQHELAVESLGFHDGAIESHGQVSAQLAELAESGRRVAIWGGTGKAAAFINKYHLDARQFPLVVDSDRDKAGTYVPGMGQEILHADVLKLAPAEVIIIATQWRARDIVLEIESMGLPPARILLEHQGRLVDYHRDAHPYRLSQTADGGQRTARP